MGALEEYTAAWFGAMRVLTSTWDCTLTGKEWGREARHPPSLPHAPPSPPKWTPCPFADKQTYLRGQVVCLGFPKE